MPDQLDNLCKLLYMLLVTVFYIAGLQAIYFNRFFSTTSPSWLPLVLIVLTYLLGPFGLLYVGHLTKLLFYRVLFFIASLTSALYVILYKVINIELSNPLQSIFLVLLTILVAPFRIIFLCTFNYYVNSLSPEESKGVYFGVAYSMYPLAQLQRLCTSSLISALYIKVAGQDSETSQSSASSSKAISIIAISVAILSSCLYWFVTEANKNSQSNLPPTTGDQLVPQRKKSYNLKKELSKILTLFRIRNIYLVLPNMFVLSMIYAYKMLISSLVTTFVVNKQLDDNVPDSSRPILIQAQLYFGIGQFTGGVFSGLVGDLISNRVYTMLYSQILSLISFILAIAAIIAQDEQLLYAQSFMLGLSLSSQQTLSFSFFASQFNSVNILTLCVGLFSIGIAINAVIFYIPYFEDTKSDTVLFYLIGYAIACILVNFGLIQTYICKQKKSEKPEELELNHNLQFY